MPSQSIAENPGACADLKLLDPAARLGEFVFEDACNARFGRGTVVPARAGLVEKRTWSTKFEMGSTRFTTRLSEVPIVAADTRERA